MRLPHLPIGLLALAVCGCGVVIPMPISMHLYPVQVQGPIAERKPVPAIPASVLGTFYTARFYVTFPDGETFQGPLRPVVPADAVNGDLAPVWDAVYGPGYYATAALGSPGRARAVLQGSKGSILFIETNRTSRDAPVEGIAKDSNGDVFKVER
jgi:hypothetical protein